MNIETKYNPLQAVLVECSGLPTECKVNDIFVEIGPNNYTTIRYKVRFPNGTVDTFEQKHLYGSTQDYINRKTIEIKSNMESELERLKVKVARL